MKIGLIAPPWLPVPPHGYGGIEEMVDILARGLQQRGHHVKLFTTGDADCPVERDYVFSRPAGPIEDPVKERVHLEHAYRSLADCDVIHDHTVHGPAMQLSNVPVVTTMHGLMIPETDMVVGRYPQDVALVAISRSQKASAPSLRWTTVIHHGIEVEKERCGEGRGDYLLFLGRMNRTKGVHTAIEVAQRAGVPLVIAAKMREPGEREYFEQSIRPHLKGDIHFLGECELSVKRDLLCDARALLNPLQWTEPFGLVMIEALAAGTPVIGTFWGSTPELISHGETGFLCRTVDEAVAAIDQLDSIDRAACRTRAARLFSADQMVRDYERLFQRIASPTSIDLRSRPRASAEV